MGIKFIATGSYVPNQIITNMDLEKIIETTDEWIKKRTGIQERRFVQNNEDNSDLAIKAVDNALQNINNISNIKLIIVATFTPDYIMPNIASKIHKHFKLNNNIFAFDVNIACSGFCGALKIAESLLNENEQAIIVGSEVISKHLNLNDRTTSILFGDGAGAVIIEKNNDYINFDYSILDDNNSLNMKVSKNSFPTISMNGPEVFSFAIKNIPITINNILKKYDLNSENIDYFVLHQANKRIIENVSKSLNININKLYSNISYYANTSAASIPIVIDEMNKKNYLKRGNKILISGFGAGFTYCSTIINW